MGMCRANLTGMGREKKKCTRFPLSGNKHRVSFFPLFLIQNLESQRKHLGSDKHTKKNHIDFERNKSVAVVCVCPVWMCNMVFFLP